MASRSDLLPRAMSRFVALLRCGLCWYLWFVLPQGTIRTIHDEVTTASLSRSCSSLALGKLVLCLPKHCSKRTGPDPHGRAGYKDPGTRELAPGTQERQPTPHTGMGELALMAYVVECYFNYVKMCKR